MMKAMRTMLRGLVVAAAAAGLGWVSGCGDAGDRYVVVTGSNTGVYYPMGQAVDAAVRASGVDVSLRVRTSGGSVANAHALGAGQADFAMMQPDVALFAFEGIEAFADQPIGNLRAVAGMYDEHVHLVVRADSGIESVADLAGRSVAIGDAGSGTEVNALQVLAAYGMSEADLGSTEHLGATQSAGRIQDGHLEAMFYTVGVGTAAIAELATSGVGLRFIAIEGEAREALLAEHGFFTASSIPAGAYGAGLPAEDVPTVAMKAMLVAREGVPAEVVEAVLSAVFADLETFRRRHAGLAGFDLESAQQGLSIPLHDGARAFYEAQGQ